MQVVIVKFVIRTGQQFEMMSFLMDLIWYVTFFDLLLLELDVNIVGMYFIKSELAHVLVREI